MNTAYLVGVIDKRSGRLVGVSIFSEPDPHWAGCYSFEIGQCVSSSYDQARADLLATIEASTPLRWVQPFYTERGFREPGSPRFSHGDRVNYHSVIGEPATSRGHTVRAMQVSEDGKYVYWITDKAGYVAEAALSLDTERLEGVDRTQHKGEGQLGAVGGVKDRPKRVTFWAEKGNADYLHFREQFDLVEDLVANVYYPGPLPDQLKLEEWQAITLDQGAAGAIELEELLETLYEKLDERFGDPEGDDKNWPPPTEVYQAGAEFLGAIYRTYEVWSCQKISSETIDVRKWLDENDRELAEACKTESEIRGEFPWSKGTGAYQSDGPRGTEPVTFAVFDVAFTVTPTGETGIHPGRRRYRVDCLNCQANVHVATTGPSSRIRGHLYERHDVPRSQVEEIPYRKEPQDAKRQPDT